MIKVREHKLTPRQFAKLCVAKYGDSAGYWMENMCESVQEAMTEREQILVEKEITLQLYRMEQFFGIDKLPVRYL